MRGVARIALAVSFASMALSPSPARAEPTSAGSAETRTARILTPGAGTLIRTGLGRLGPHLAIRVLAGEEGQVTLRTHLGRLVKQANNPGMLAALKRDPEGRPHPTFVGKDGLTEAGRSLVAWLGRARFHALDLAIPDGLAELDTATLPIAPPPVDAIEAAWEAGRGATDRLEATVRELARRGPQTHDAVGAVDEAALRLATADFALADAYARLLVGLAARPRASKVHADASGRYLSPDTLWRDLSDSGLSDDETSALLTAGFAAAREGRLDAHLAGLLPRHPQYRLLVGAAERYARICEAGGFTEITLPENPKLIRAPDFVKALQVRLSKEGFFLGEANGTWDDATTKAVADARRVRHLKDRGDVDKDLIAALSASCEDRLMTLVLNVRRWRHSAYVAEPERVEVNLAAQIVRYFRDGELIKKERTVVGSDKSFFSKIEGKNIWRNSSPILHDTISVVVVNPTWNVPKRIARDEIEPEIAKDPTYLERMNFVVHEFAGGRTYIQQPGPGNALGRIKILFPNSESVYLHDTPGKKAFRLPVRALSHGCVRVDNALDFGSELIRADRAKRGEAFDPNRVRWLTQASTKTWAFQILDPIPVFLEYYTASVDEDGALWFHPDIYGYDAETKAIEASAP